jgi:hypothetical protein
VRVLILSSHARGEGKTQGTKEASSQWQTRQPGWAAPNKRAKAEWGCRPFKPARSRQPADATGA